MELCLSFGKQKVREIFFRTLERLLGKKKKAIDNKDIIALLYSPETQESQIQLGALPDLIWPEHIPGESPDQLHLSLLY